MDQPASEGESRHIAEPEYAGQRLGLPPSGAGSVGGFGRRVSALFIDWFAAYVIAAAITRDVTSSTFSWLVLVVFAAELWLLTSLSGASFGQRLTRIRVAGLGGRGVDPLRVLLRTLLICLIIPAVVWDRDGRGLHDRVANSVVVRV